MEEKIEKRKMADVLEEVHSMDISKLKVPDLKKELKNRGLSTTGNKNELVERLQAAMKSNDGTTADTIDEEDLLNDDDDEHLDEQESLINDLEDSALDDLPKTQKRKLEPESEKAEVMSGAPKKVILKRNTSETLAALARANEENKAKEEKADEKPKETANENANEENSEKKVIKLSELSVKERLEMRAKKFGVTALSDDAKKLARAERFGGSNVSNSAASIKMNGSNASIDVLKQRAARFGGSVSSIMSDLEKQEKMEKRKERFGRTASTDAKPTSNPDAAKAARLERFKTTVK